MRFFRSAFLVVLSCSAALAQTTQHGVVLSDMDRSVDPCVDFYEYGNGAWRAANPIPPSMSRWSRRWQAGENNKEQLKNILDEVSAKQDWPSGSIEQLIGDYYAACMDGKRADQLGISPIKPLLTDIDAIDSSAALQRMIGRLHAISIPVPFGITSMPDNHNPQNVIADVYAAGLGLPDRDYYFKSEPRFAEARQKYVAHVARMFELAGYKPEDAKMAAATVMAFETKLADASLDNVALRDPNATDHKTTFADLQKLAPNFQWARYFDNAGIAHADLNVDQPKFLATVNEQLSATLLADWKTYLKWQTIHSAANTLSAAFVEEDFNFYEAYLGGAKEMKPRWKRCSESTDQLLGEALGKKYVERYFPPEAKARTRELVDNLLLAMKEDIQGLSWMSDQTKTKALEKLSTFVVKVGYPDKWKDYSSVKIRRDTFWQDTENARVFNVNDDRSQIAKPLDRKRWGMTPPTSDAYYNPLLNEIVFPAGILQPPAFSLQATDAINYGAIGVVIGHEISHGFDDQGAQFDAQGRLNNWWTPDDYKKFQQRGQCVVEQFDNYYIEPGIHHNGKLVLGESIGDLGGVSLAYRAFQIAQRKHPAPAIDGFTPDQQFFIAWDQFRGDAVRPETQRLMVQGDPHPIGKYRVIGPLSNTPQFQKAFGCKPGSPMVRPADKRCEIW